MQERGTEAKTRSRTMRTKTSDLSNAHQAVAAERRLEIAGANVSDIQLCADGQRYGLESIVHRRARPMYQ